MKACDVRGVEVLDKVFLADPVDSFYAARREHGTIVAFACSEPEETCFCKAFGIDAAEVSRRRFCLADRRYSFLATKYRQGRGTYRGSEEPSGGSRWRSCGMCGKRRLP